LLSLPEEARRQVLKYGKEGSSSYFVTEPLPAGDRLKEWVERQSGKQTPSSAPSVGAPTLGNQGQLTVEAHAASPNLAQGNMPKTERPVPAAPGASEPRVRPMRAPEPSPDPGPFTAYTTEEILGDARPGHPVAETTRIYGADELRDHLSSLNGPEASYSEPEVAQPTQPGEMGPGLATLIFGLPKPAEPLANPIKAPETLRNGPNTPMERTPVVSLKAAAPAFELPPVPLHRVSAAPSAASSRTPAPSRIIDWHTVLLVMITVLIVAGIVVLIAKLTG